MTTNAVMPAIEPTDDNGALADPLTTTQTANRYYFIGKAIKAIREEKKLSQSAVATMAGLSQAQMSNYEKGTNVPMPDSLFKLCQALDVDPLVFALKCLEQTELIDSRNALMVTEYEEIAQEAIRSIKEKRKRIHQRDDVIAVN